MPKFSRTSISIFLFTICAASSSHAGYSHPSQALSIDYGQFRELYRQKRDVACYAMEIEIREKCRTGFYQSMKQHQLSYEELTRNMLNLIIMRDMTKTGDRRKRASELMAMLNRVEG